MPLNRERVRRCLAEYRFDDLFIDELGWDVDARAFAVTIKEQVYSLRAVAHKRGLVVLRCDVPPGESYPYALRRQIEARVTRDVREHILIFVDAARGTQAWQRVHRHPNQPDRAVEHTYAPGAQSGEALVQRLEQLHFSFEQEAGLDLLDVTRAADSALRAERVTKRFYDLFKARHTAFLKFIAGIPGERDREWYASIMLNRLMFVYFIQAKGFLDGDVNYLSNRLRLVREQLGPNRFHSFYRSFLLVLFHDGLARKPDDRDAATNTLIGRIPYLNGGIFEVHELESQYDHIDIPDKAFEEIFAFFNQYQWHLDDRPLRDDNEINPDVLGYIFEKYINQKQMGAYYTKEDITEYIGKNTIIPFLFDAVEKGLKAKAKPDAYQAVFGLLSEDPDRYIYPAMRHGVTWDIHANQPLAKPFPYPENIAIGLDTATPDLLKRRRFWNTKTPPETALPTEIWRETIARHQRYAEVKTALQTLTPASSGALPPTPPPGNLDSPDPTTLDVRNPQTEIPPANSAHPVADAAREETCNPSAPLHEVDATVCGFGSAAAAEPNPQTLDEGGPGEVATSPGGARGQSPALFSINDLITYNCDIRRFAQDVIERTDDPDVLNAFWRGISGVTVLDPTCGSGAFLFAALNILEPLYESCLSRMRAFMLDWSAEKKQPHPNYYKSFAEVIAHVDDHPNEQYFIYKSIIIGNLYGVDIMDEAIEICKLRLFLKLASLVQPDPAAKNYGIEPLPDIDFNIRAGNTLVGFATYDEVRRAILGDRQGLLDLGNDMERIENKIKTVADVADVFRRQQTERGARVTPEDKRELRSELAALDEELNRYLANQYGVDPAKSAKYAAWKDSHKPFHWFVEFYRIVHEHGGFDVIIGNPPYVQLSVCNTYNLLGYTCTDCGNLYPVVIERCCQLVSKTGRHGYIVPVSSVSTEGYAAFQKLMASRSIHFSNFDDRPSRLFDGLEHIRLTIHLIRESCENGERRSTRYNKWSAEERESLFSTMRYARSANPPFDGSWGKTSDHIELSILGNVLRKRQLSAMSRPNSPAVVNYSRKVGYFLQVLNFTPEVRDGNGNLRAPSEFKQLAADHATSATSAVGALNSSLFYWFTTIFSDCRHLNTREVNAFPIIPSGKDTLCDLTALATKSEELMHNLKATAEVRKMKFKHDTLTVQCIIPKHSKLIIDEIDTLLAEHYGFTDEELDFIINYDIKYRMGDELENYVDQTVKKWE